MVLLLFLKLGLTITSCHQTILQICYNQLARGQGGLFTAMSENILKQANVITARVKGLQAYLQPEELPCFSQPAIWVGGTNKPNETCEVVITNKRVIGFYYRSFPREKVFLDTVDLASINRVTFLQKSYEPIFRDIVIKAGSRTISLRTPGQKAEALFNALQEAAPSSQISTTEEAIETVASANNSVTPEPEPAHISSTNMTNTTYERQTTRNPFSASAITIILLFIGGIILEIVGAIVWAGTASAPTGLPLCIAGFIAVVAAILQTRQRR